MRNSDGSKGLGLTHQHSPGFSCDLVKSVPVSVKWRVQDLFREADVRPRQVDGCKVPTRGLAQTTELGSRKPLPSLPPPWRECLCPSEHTTGRGGSEATDGPCLRGLSLSKFPSNLLLPAR